MCANGREKGRMAQNEVRCMLRPLGGWWANCLYSDWAQKDAHTHKKLRYGLIEVEVKHQYWNQKKKGTVIYVKNVLSKNKDKKQKNMQRKLFI